MKGLSNLFWSVGLSAVILLSGSFKPDDAPLSCVDNNAPDLPIGETLIGNSMVTSSLINCMKYDFKEYGLGDEVLATFDQNVIYVTDQTVSSRSGDYSSRFSLIVVDENATEAQKELILSHEVVHPYHYHKRPNLYDFRHHENKLTIYDYAFLRTLSEIDANAVSYEYRIKKYRAHGSDLYQPTGLQPQYNYLYFRFAKNSLIDEGAGIDFSQAREGLIFDFIDQMDNINKRQLHGYYVQYLNMSGGLLNTSEPEQFISLQYSDLKDLFSREGRDQSYISEELFVEAKREFIEMLFDKIPDLALSMDALYFEETGHSSNEFVLN